MNREEKLLSEMIRIRRVEETLADLYPSQEMRTPTHFSIGQEAVAVGVCAALRRDDVVYSSATATTFRSAWRSSPFDWRR